jgi:hypothetical protein
MKRRASFAAYEATMASVATVAWTRPRERGLAYIADALMQADGVAVVSDAGQLGLERGGIGDVFEVGLLAFDIDEQRLDPGLIDSQQLHAHAI